MEPIQIRSLPSMERPQINTEDYKFEVKVEKKPVSLYRDKVRESMYRANITFQMDISPKILKSAIE